MYDLSTKNYSKKFTKNSQRKNTKTQKMKILFGKEIVTIGKFNEQEHKIYLEDDMGYKELRTEPQILLSIKKDDATKIINYIRDTQILGVDNAAVNLMHALKKELMTKIKDRQAENIIHNLINHGGG